VDHCYLLSDLGEGKTISKTLETGSGHNQTAGRDIGLNEYQAPEGYGQENLKKQDIFAWAQLGVDIIRLNYTKLADENGEVLFPVRLMRLLEHCLHPDLRFRFEADHICHVIDEIKDGSSGLATEDEGEVEYFEGSYKLPEVRRRLSSSVQLSDKWYQTS
jgi:hypothetical protein